MLQIVSCILRTEKFILLFLKNVHFCVLSILTFFLIDVWFTLGFPGSLVIKESTCNAGDLSSIPESGKSSGEGSTTLSHILAWEIPWTTEPGGLQSMGSQRSQS